MVKKTSKYWQKRFEALEVHQHRSAYRLQRELEKDFIKAERDILNLIEKWYQTLIDNNEDVSIADVRRFVTQAELKEFKWELEDYIAYGKKYTTNKKWVNQMENASARVHINYLDLAKQQITNRLEVLYHNYDVKLAKLAEKAITETYYHSMFEVHKGFNIGWKIQAFDERRLNKIMQFPWSADSKTFSQNIWDDKLKLTHNLHKELTQMTLRGGRPDDAINNMARMMKTSRSNSRRLVMTESSYFYSASQEEVYKELNVEQYQIVATLDSRTSKICQSLDLQVYNMKDYSVGITAPPFHPYCRTVTVPYFDDEFTIGSRAARGIDGKTYYVPGNMKYEDWFEKHAA